MSVEAAAIIGILGRIPLFSIMPPEALSRLAGQLDTRRCQAGECIVKVNEPGDSFFYILSGKVKVFRPLKNGQEAVVGLLGAGEFFGEQALLDGRPRTASVYTVEPTALLILKRESFLQFIQSDTKVMLALIWVLSDRIRNLNIQLEEAYHMTLPQRVAHRLQELGKKHGKVDGGGLTIQASLTLGDLAGMVGGSLEQVTGILSKWQERGIVRLSWDKEITIVSIKDLEYEATGRPEN